MKASIALVMTLVAGCSGTPPEDDDGNLLSDSDGGGVPMLDEDLARIGCVVVQDRSSDIYDWPEVDALLLQPIWRERANHTHAFGLRGENMYTCEAGSVQRIGLYDGQREEFPIGCTAVVADEDGIVVADTFTIADYEDANALHARSPTTVFQHAGVGAMALHRDVIVRPRTDLAGVEHIDRRDGRVIEVVRFPRRLEAVYGLDRVDDGRYVVVVPDAIETYASDGRRLSSVPLGELGTGLDGIECGIEPQFEPLESAPEIFEPR